MEETIIDLFNRLLEQLHLTDNNGLGSRSINLTYVAPGAQNIGSLNTQNNYQAGDAANATSRPAYDTPPPPEAMARAVEKTMAEGYWWASTAWAVAYRVYQIKGYTGSIKQFVREVEDWPWQKASIYPCTYDGIQKPIVSGKLVGTIDKWEKNGATEQMQKLGVALIELLN